MNYSEIVEKALRRFEVLDRKDATARFHGVGGGCESGRTVITNRKYFNHIYLTMKLIDSKWADTSTELFGQHLTAPIMSGAMSGMNDVDEKPLITASKGLAKAGLMF